MTQVKQLNSLIASLLLSAPGLILPGPLWAKNVYRANMGSTVSAPSQANPRQKLNPQQNNWTTTQAMLQEDSYIIGPGDILELRLFDADELSGKLEVLNDGTVPLPLAGSVRISGLTLQQATFWVRKLLSKQLLRPELQLRVLTPRPIRVAIVGEVERPGLYSLTTSEASTTVGAINRISGLPTVVDAIQKAGGITQQANLREVVLQRRMPGIDPSFKQAELDLLALLLEGNQSNNPFLFDGDIIRISKAAEIPAEAIELAAANLSPQMIQVNVIGEVNNPGRLEVMANTPLVQAVLAAGGPKSWRASKGNVELVRINRNGSATFERFKLNLAEGASNSKNPPLRNGDTVRVNPNNLAIASDAIGAVSQPVSGLVTIWSLYRLINTSN
ncbi:MAG TPA: sugar transporter [Synechococcales bacterium UBA10510]|nr:sugar transporter [Synechococcales bacterium UBA10510]